MSLEISCKTLKVLDEEPLFTNVFCHLLILGGYLPPVDLRQLGNYKSLPSILQLDYQTCTLFMRMKSLASI